MKHHTVTWALTATACAALLAACGGGSSSPAAPSGPSVPTGLQVSGTAATGAALAGASVDVKCAAGTPSAATTGSAGAYTVTVTGGTLPCIVRVTGTAADGTPVTLHSLANGSGTANVTPLTEMVVAQLAGANPTELYGRFDGSGVTATTLAQATTRVVTALKDATGIDLGSIDPFKAELVPATTTRAGNDYDKALDALGAKLPVAGLPVLVAQIANAAAAGSSAGLTDAMQSVNLGALANCPTALSGKYRTLEYLGRATVVTFDFKALTASAQTASGTVSAPITPSSTQACQFSVGSSTYYMGPSGAGAVRTFDSIGYVFPVQSHAFASVVGEWSLLESGVEETNEGAHYAGRINVGASRSASLCFYDTTLSSCVPSDEQISVEDHAADGGFLLREAGDPSPANVWGYKAPNGSFTLYGSSNASGTRTAGSYRTHFVAARLQPLALPAVGAVSRFWNLTLDYVPTATQPFQVALNAVNASTIAAVDNANASVTRQLSTGASDVLLYNKPFAGLRSRTAINPAVHVVLPGLGITTIVDNRADIHAFSLAVTRP